ncbi:hypothetical protein BGX27_006151 [Mortierella sp. AM989]|nr:hypothetical protein BGX27_006151 [Mortierella sp. AM989]
MAVKNISNSGVSLHIAQPKPKSPTKKGSNNYFTNKLDGIKPTLSLSKAIDTCSGAADDSSPRLNSSPITFAAAYVHPLHTASEDALQFPRVEGRRVISSDRQSSFFPTNDDDDDALAHSKLNLDSESLRDY